jgi:hypothetical protein
LYAVAGFFLLFLAFFLFYRFAETQLLKIIVALLLDPRSKGGLGLTTTEVGIIYGTVGVIALMLGGLLGGYAIYRKGLKFWIWIMVCAIHLPDLVFVYLSQAMPSNFYLINFAVVRGAIRLRLWIYSLHDVHDHGVGGGIQNSPLRHLHRDHGPGDDGAGHVQWLAPGAKESP